MADCCRRVSPKFAIFIGNVSGAFVHNRGIFGLFTAFAFAGFGVSGRNCVINIAVCLANPTAVLIVLGNTYCKVVVIRAVHNLAVCPAITG